MESAQQILSTQASTLLSSKEIKLSRELRVELQHWLTESFDKLTEERKKERRAERTQRAAISDAVHSVHSTSSSSDEIEVCTEKGKSVRKGKASAVSHGTLSRAATKLKSLATLLLQEEKGRTTTEISTKPATLETTPASTTTTEMHYITYIPAPDTFYWAKIFALYVVVLGTVIYWYYAMCRHHVYECGFVPQYKCASLPHNVFGVSVFDEGVRVCLFWPKGC